MTTSINIQELLNNFGEEGKIVGFKNKFYTLWEYKITKNNATGEYAFDAYYIKNLGIENRLEGLYYFDSSLKGTEIHIKYFEPGTGRALTHLQFKALRFSKSPEYGKMISECEDCSLLCWKYNNNVIDRSISESRQAFEKANICNRALELGAKLVNDRLYPQEKLEGTIFSRTPMLHDKIAECNDLSLLCWKYNNKAVDDSRPNEIVEKELENIKNRALELGAIYLNDWFYDINKDFVKQSLEMIEKINNNEILTINSESNLNSIGDLKQGIIRFNFDYKYYPATYYGPEYYLPVDKKGKGKRIKNKTIEIISYEKIDDITFKVLDWKFKK